MFNDKRCFVAELRRHEEFLDSTPGLQSTSLMNRMLPPFVRAPSCTHSLLHSSGALNRKQPSSAGGQKLNAKFVYYRQCLTGRV